METYRRTAVIVGVLFIIGTVSGILSGVLTLPILDGADYLTKVAANESQLVLGSIFVLLMGFSLAMAPVMMFPIFRKFNEVLALGAVVFRGVLEAVCYIGTVICWLMLITLSQASVAAETLDAPSFQLSGALLLGAVDWFNLILAIVFCLGALMLYWMFWRTKLVPGWLALWGFIGAILYLVVPLLNMFDPQHPAPSLTSGVGLLMAPLALQEMVFALWLIVKGFNTPANIPEPAS
ncbi:MAG: DUF4386 domain-containing protein [Caldilineales bacterium]|nr:DUF4386 domain-containing protein [Caldilineales bacterium]